MRKSSAVNGAPCQLTAFHASLDEVHLLVCLMLEVEAYSPSTSKTRINTEPCPIPLVVRRPLDHKPPTW